MNKEKEESIEFQTKTVANLNENDLEMFGRAVRLAESKAVDEDIFIKSWSMDGYFLTFKAYSRLSELHTGTITVNLYEKSVEREDTTY